MAVEKVGGTYVIKASPVKAGTTSTGQSWANLVTQQKYQLWKIANAEAARRIKFEQMNAQRQQQVVDQMRRDLMRQQEDTRNQISNLKQLQVEDVAKQQADIARETNLRGRPERRTISGGAGGGYSGQKYNLTVEEGKLRTQNQRALTNLLRAQGKAEDVGADATTLTRWAEGKDISPEEQNVINKLGPAADTLAQAIEDAQNQYTFTSGTLNEFLNADEAGRHKFVQDRLSAGAGGGFGGGGSRTYYTKGQPIVAAPVVDREPAIKELEDRLKQLEKQQLELKDVDIPVGDEIRTTRQILGSKFGEGTQRLPEQPMAQPAPAPVREQPQVQEQVQEQAQDLSNVRPVDREILELGAEPADMEPARKTQPQAQTVKKPRIAPTEETVEEPAISLTDLATMAYGDQPTVLDESMQRYTQPMGTAARYESETDLGDFTYTEMDAALDRMGARRRGEDLQFQSSTAETQEFPTFRPSTAEVVDPFPFKPSTAEVQPFPQFRPSTAEVQEFPTFRPSTAEVQEFPTFRPSTAEVQEFPTFRPSTAEVQPFPQFRPSSAEVVSTSGKRPPPTLEVVDQAYSPEGFEPYKFQPSTPVVQSQQDINRNVLQQMRQAEIEALQGIVEESMPKATPFREVKAVMDQASKTFNNADLQIAGLQMLQDYAYLQQTDPEEYYKIKDVVQSAVAKRLNKKEYEVQQAAKVLIKANQVTAQKLANTVKGATVKDAELVMQLTGSLFDNINSIESSYENARQQINSFADKGGLTEDQRTQMLTLLENYKAYKSLVVER